MASKPGPDAVMYCRARCYPNARGYRVDFRPTGGNELQHPLPRARWFPSLGEAMAWAYEVGNTSSLRLDGLTLTAGRDLHT